MLIIFRRVISLSSLSYTFIYKDKESSLSFILKNNFAFFIGKRFLINMRQIVAIESVQ